jgi:hypothetical protein
LSDILPICIKKTAGDRLLGVVVEPLILPKGLWLKGPLFWRMREPFLTDIGKLKSIVGIRM